MVDRLTPSSNSPGNSNTLVSWLRKVPEMRQAVSGATAAMNIARSASGRGIERPPTSQSVMPQPRSQQRPDR
jgi:hypothetical protein